MLQNVSHAKEYYTYHIGKPCLIAPPPPPQARLWTESAALKRRRPLDEAPNSPLTAATSDSSDPEDPQAWRAKGGPGGHGSAGDGWADGQFPMHFFF